MWVEALERCLSQLVAQGAPLGRVAAISGSAQQHGSVYWQAGALRTLQDLDPARTLSEQLGAAFAVPDSPVWMDSSTTAECLALEEAGGGAAEVARVTGSRAFERFTGNQIAKLLREEPARMRGCERIALISSFLASLLTGGYAPIDASDASGMNLLDIHSRTWDPSLVQAVASRYAGGEAYNLGSRLGEVVESFSCVGQVSPFFAKRYGFAPTCRVVAFSGDNNNALVGLKLTGSDMAVSLGTSDTIFASLRRARPREVGHVFAHPVLEGGFMAMLCYANGSLTREKIRDQNLSPSWAAFEASLRSTSVGNGGKVGFYFLNREIVPQGGHGVHTFDAQGRRCTLSKDENVRAVVEGQFLSMRLHTAQLGLEITPQSRIFVTGGGSKSGGILQVLADVFGCSVMRDTKGSVNSAAFGAALRAAHGFRLITGGHTHGDSEGVYNEMVASQQTFKTCATPNHAATATYTGMLERYQSLEDRVMSKNSKL